MDEDKNLLAVVPFGMPGYTPGSNYTLIACHKCNQTCWIGPLQLQKKKEENLETWCYICLAPLMAKSNQEPNFKHLGGVSGTYANFPDSGKD